MALKKVKHGQLANDHPASQPGAWEQFLNFGLANEREFFLENLAMLSASGMSILPALQAIRRDTNVARMRVLLDRMITQIKSGFTLWRVMSGIGLFSDYEISLVKLGEKSGRLSQNLQVISDEKNRQRLFKSRLRSAMLYPVFVLILAVVIGLLIAWFILPRLANVFSSMKIELPLISKILIGFGKFLAVYGYFAVPMALIFFLLLFFFVFFFKPTKFLGENVLLNTPGIKKLIKEVELGRLGSVLGNLLKAGLPIDEALRSLADATTIQAYRRFYIFIEQKIQAGLSLGQAFKRYPKTNKFLPIFVQQMIESGERSGYLSETLVMIGQKFEVKTEMTTKNLAVLVEPVLLVIVWLAVLAVALGVVMPIYKMIGNLNKQTGAAGRVNTSEQTSLPTPPLPESQAMVPELPVETGVATSAVTQVITVLAIKVSASQTGFANFRSQPNTQAEIIGRLLNGQRYEVVGEENEWWQIKLADGVLGWLAKEYAQVIP